MRNCADALKKSGTKPSALTKAVLSFLASPEDPGCAVLSLPTLRADHAVPKAVTAAGGRVLDLRKLWDGPPPWNPDPRKAERDFGWSASTSLRDGLIATRRWIDSNPELVAEGLQNSVLPVRA